MITFFVPEPCEMRIRVLIQWSLEMNINTLVEVTRYLNVFFLRNKSRYLINYCFVFHENNNYQV
jgi:hypothetical protein